VKRNSFTLIELLIVVLIIGIVYSLAITNFQNLKEGKTEPNLLNLKTKLDSLDKVSTAKLMCLDECESCYIYVDDVLDEEVSKEFEDFFDEEVRVYRYDVNYGLVELKDKIFFNSEGVEEDICFSLSVDKNGVSEQVIVEYKDKFYDFSVYFTNTQVYKSQSELREIREYLLQKVLR
jgi:prepilin-type N-terminal cleavage/methylation domain-containing protein